MTPRTVEVKFVGSPVGVPIYVTVDQAAEQLDVTPKTVRRWIREGKLRAHRLGGRGGRIRIRQSDVVRFVEGTEALEPPNREQQKALNAKAAALARHRGVTKDMVKAGYYRAAGKHFNRLIERWEHLESYDEASWILDQLEAELYSAGITPTPKPE